MVSTFNLRETLNLLYYFRVIIKSMVLVSSSVKICDFFFPCRTRQRRVGAMSEKQKKKKKKHRRTPESGASYVSDTDDAT